MLNIQILLIIFIIFGISIISLFGLDLYFLIRNKKTKEEESLSLKFSEKFLIDLDKMIKEEIKNQILKINQKIYEDIADIYKKEVPKLSNLSVQIENSVTNEVKKIIDELNKKLDTEIGKMYKLAGETINKSVLQTQKNIENYKKEKLKEIDEKIYQLIGNITKKIIGKTIDLSTHEELVFKILEEAKKELF